MHYLGLIFRSKYMVIAILLKDELTDEDRTLVDRTRKIERFLSQQ